MIGKENGEQKNDDKSMVGRHEIRQEGRTCKCHWKVLRGSQYRGDEIPRQVQLKDFFFGSPC